MARPTKRELLPEEQVLAYTALAVLVAAIGLLVYVTIA